MGGAMPARDGETGCAASDDFDLESLPEARSVDDDVATRSLLGAMVIPPTDASVARDPPWISTDDAGRDSKAERIDGVCMSRDAGEPSARPSSTCADDRHSGRAGGSDKGASERPSSSISISVTTDADRAICEERSPITLAEVARSEGDIPICVERRFTATEPSEARTARSATPIESIGVEKARSSPVGTANADAAA